MSEEKEKEELSTLIQHFGYEVVASLGFKALPRETQSVAIKEFQREYQTHPRKKLYELLEGKVWARFVMYPHGKVLTFFLPEEW